jgi:hypothetical protein
MPLPAASVGGATRPRAEATATGPVPALRLRRRLRAAPVAHVPQSGGGPVGPARHNDNCSVKRPLPGRFARSGSSASFMPNARRPRLEVNAMKLVLRSLTRDRVSGIREDVVKALSAAEGRRRDTLFCTGEYRYASRSTIRCSIPASMRAARVNDSLFVAGDRMRIGSTSKVGKSRWPTVEAQPLAHGRFGNPSVAEVGATAAFSPAGYPWFPFHTAGVPVSHLHRR